MNAMSIAAQMTADEYLLLPYDGRRTQLVAGEVVLDAPAWTHQFVCTDLLFALVTWTRAEAGRGVAILPVDVRLDDRNVYNPDILWYGEERAPRRGDSRPYPIPDIAVEVRSPSTWRYDVGVKKSVYEQRALPELWLVDPRAQTVLVFRRSRPRAAGFDVALELERDELLTSAQLPGFALALGELFADTA
jgi:Uma2 family endonuclease